MTGQESSAVPVWRRKRAKTAAVALLSSPVATESAREPRKVRRTEDRDEIDLWLRVRAM
jgi:hypothetical protein